MFGKDKKKLQTWETKSKNNINLIELRKQYSEYCSKITKNASHKELFAKNPDKTYSTALIPKFSDWYQKTNDDWEKVEHMDDKMKRHHCEHEARMEWYHRRDDIYNKIEAEEEEKAKIKEKAVFINKKLELTEKELLAELLWTLSDDTERKLKAEEEREEDRRDKATMDAYTEKLDREDQLEELKKISKIAKDENDFKKYGDGSR
jgi:HrpA-like RNA helicase